MITVKVGWFGRVMIIKPTTLELVALIVVLGFIGGIILLSR